MRDYEFRGKDKETGEWRYGTLLVVHDSQGEIVESYIISATRDYKADYAYCPLVIKRKMVDPETVGQYTGLKDKNGKKIFEGDICSVPAVKSNGVIAFDNGTFAYKDPANYMDMPLRDIAIPIEIIGNRWDNPEFVMEVPDAD